MRWLWRYWPWLPPSRREIWAIVVGVAFVAAVVIAMLKFPRFGAPTSPSLGPDWDCATVPYGGSACVKRLPSAKNKQDAK